MAKAKRVDKAKKGGKAKSAAKVTPPKKAKVNAAKVTPPKKAKVTAKVTPKVSPATKVKPGPGKAKKAAKAAARGKTGKKVKAAQPQVLATAEALSTTIPYQAIAIRAPYGTDAEPTETLQPTFIADGVVSPYHATSYAQVFSGSTAASNQYSIQSYASAGQWYLPPFTKPGGGDLDPGTYSLRVWMADDSAAQEITIVITNSLVQPIQPDAVADESEDSALFEDSEDAEETPSASDSGDTDSLPSNPPEEGTSEQSERSW